MSQEPIYYLTNNEWGAHPEGTYVVQVVHGQGGNQTQFIQKVEWTNNEWVIAAPPYENPVYINPADVHVIAGYPIHMHAGAEAYFTRWRWWSSIYTNWLESNRPIRRFRCRNHGG